MLASDYANQANDDQLYPGNASDAIVKQLPPTCVFTSEFDFLMRDSKKMADRLKKFGKLIDIFVMPGCSHACMGV